MVPFYGARRLSATACKKYFNLEKYYLEPQQLISIISGFPYKSLMGRKTLIRTSTFPYHVTSRSNNRQWFDLPMQQVWDLCLKSLTHASSKYKVEIISFVLMSNHYHMLIRTPNEDLDLFMYEFNKTLSLEIRIASKRVNRIFGGRYKWCLIKSQKYFSNCYRYVYQNPLRANIVDRSEFYPYSSLYYLANQKIFPTQLHDLYGVCDEHKLLWINDLFKENEVQGIRNGLGKSTLTKLKCPKTRKLLS